MKWIAIVVGIVLLLAAGAVGLYRRYMAGAATDPAFFAAEIESFVEADRAQPPAPGQIVFVGSSSIRFWTTLAEDMAPLATVRRGFGGAHLSQVLHEAPRIVLPYAPRAVVVYAGDNDIGAGKSAETVVADFEALVERIHATLPETDVWFWSIKPSRLLLGAVLLTQMAATLIAVYGLFMTPIGWGWALTVWGYALAWFLVNDRVKLLTYRVLNGRSATA